jgi:hypothetical protein
MEAVILVLLFIILIFLILIKHPSNEVKWLRVLIGLLVLGVSLRLAIPCIERENLEEPSKVTTNISDDSDFSGSSFAFDTDDSEFSAYGNIRTSNDIDSMTQRQTALDWAQASGVADNELDNSDLVEDFMNKGSSIFQPNTAQGVTSTKSAYHSNFTLHEPGLAMQYSTPVNSRGYTADEGLSRLQQHRSSVNKRAIDGAVRTTRNRFAKFFRNELDETEKRVWYSAEASDIETDFRPYE